MTLFERKKILQGNINRTPYEEAELRGLYAHPDNQRARELLAKEYLSSLGLSEFGDDEKEEFRKIRAEIYKTQSTCDKILSGNMKDKEPNNINTTHNNGSLDEWNYLCTLAKLTSLTNFWETQHPLEVMNQIIYRTQKPQVLSQSEAISLEIGPSDFELFLLSKLGSIDIGWQDTNSNLGSLGVLESMNCMNDTMRTKQFLISIRESILHLRKNKNHIHLCDAGCGAVPILAIYACLLDEKVKCTCLELNQTSVEIAKKVIASFGLENRIKVIHTDAIEYNTENKFDILVSETMHSGLTEEPIVQIFKNLHKFISEGGDVIPRSVNVKSALVSIKDFFGTGKVVRIYSKSNLHHYMENTLPIQYTLDTKNPDSNIEYELTAEKDDTFMVILLSDLDLGNGIELKEYESLITMPQVAQDSDGSPRLLKLKKGDKIRVSYTAGNKQQNIKIVRL